MMAVRRPTQAMSGKKVAAGWVLALAGAAAAGQEAPHPGATQEEIHAGAQIYEQNCSPCHGPRMLDPQGAFDLRTFPRDQKGRFVISVTKGKNNMPPWGGLLTPQDIDALWAYVLANGNP